MNHVIEKMYYNGREIVLIRKDGVNRNECSGCLFEREPSCSLVSVDYPCWNRDEGYCEEVNYIFKFKEEL